MKHAWLLLLLMTLMTACVKRAPVPAEAPHIEEIACDVGEQLKLLYPPAQTRLVLLSNDRFGRQLTELLRKAGYAVNENRGNGITIGYIVDYKEDERSLLVMIYLGDTELLTRSYHVNPPGRKKYYTPTGGWSHREMETTEEGDGMP